MKYVKTALFSAILAFSAMGVTHVAMAEDGLQKASTTQGQLSDFDRKTYVTNPSWSVTPSNEDIVAAYKAFADGKRGSVVMDCPVLETGLFGACRLVTATPPDEGMAQAALSLMPKFQMKTKDGGGKPVSGRTMRMSLAFAPVG